jgi:FlaA1/EpsC-like NDP-sugar epimerase
MNIAKALVGDRDIEIKISGIRPGEKMHEIMVSEEEANHCVKRGDDYYAIRPMLPELRTDDYEINALTKEFSSSDSVLNLDATVELLEEHQLMVEDVVGSASQVSAYQELLR